MKQPEYPKFTLYMTPELEKLLNAVRHAVKTTPQESPERDRAKQALGQYVYRVYNDLNPDQEDML